MAPAPLLQLYIALPDRVYHVFYWYMFSMGKTIVFLSSNRLLRTTMQLKASSTFWLRLRHIFLFSLLYNYIHCLYIN